MPIWLVLVIALITGLLGATIGAATTWRIFKKQSAKSIGLEAGVTTFRLPTEDRPPWYKLFYVTVLNRSLNRSIVVESIQLHISGLNPIELGGLLYRGHWAKLPCSISPDSAETFWTDFNQMRRVLEELDSDTVHARILMTDRMGELHTLKRVKFDRREIGRDMRIKT